MAPDSFPLDRFQRIADALEAAHEALKLAERELAASAAEPARWRWVALGLVSALQASLIAALSGYETAEDDAITVPGQPDRIAPVALLLRRARADAYLQPPERPDLTAGAIARLEALTMLRNAAVHGLAFRVPADSARLADTSVQLMQHLLVRRPAFAAASHGVVLALIADVLARLEAALSAQRD